MTRDEAVRLVSRALAVIQFVTAMEEITYLPSRLSHREPASLPRGEAALTRRVRNTCDRRHSPAPRSGAQSKSPRAGGTL